MPSLEHPVVSKSADDVYSHTSSVRIPPPDIYRTRDKNTRCKGE